MRQVRELLGADPVTDWLVCRALLRTADRAGAAGCGGGGDVDVAGCRRDVGRLEKRVRIMERRAAASAAAAAAAAAAG